MITFHIVTLFPKVFEPYLSTSILGRARKAKKIACKFYNIYDYVEPRKRVDDRPYGGGPGMVMRPEPVIKAVAKAVGRKKDVKVVLFSPSGSRFTSDMARGCAKKTKHIVLVCGRYEGIDARVRDIFNAEEVSVGPYVLTGGELPALVIIDAVSRHVQGVLGKSESLEENRVAGRDAYTRPQELVYRKKHYRIPDVLISGRHSDIDKWRDAKKGGSRINPEDIESD